MSACMRRVAMILATRHVRRLSIGAARDLMDVAAARDFSHKGNRSWLAQQEGRYERCYLVPVPDSRLQSMNMRCILVLLDRANRAVWMSLDVSPWTALVQPRLRGKDVTRVMAWLASNSSAVHWDGSLSS